MRCPHVTILPLRAAGANLRRLQAQGALVELPQRATAIEHGLNKLDGR